jgi:hypothetical protein
MSRARDFADLAGSADAGGLTGRNLIYNGAYTVWQRSTSKASIASRAYHTADRWLLEYSSGGTWTQSRSTEVPSGQGFGYSLKMDCTTAQSSPTYLMHCQVFEGQDLQQLAKGTSGAKELTLSFWVRSNKTGDYTAELYDLDNNRHISKTYTINSADTWEKKSITYDGDTSGAFTNDANSSLILNMWLAANSSTYGSGTQQTTWAAASNANRVDANQVNLADSTSNEWYITGVQLEVGQATPFEHRSTHDEQLRCFRYYYDARFGSNDGGAYSPGRDAQYGHVRACIAEFPVKMRATPTVSIQSSSANSMDRFGRGQEECFPKADNVHDDHFQNIVKYTSSAQTTTANWTDSGLYISRGGYKADAEL